MHWCRCPYGIKCRFASAHLTSDYKNVVKEGADPSSKEINEVSKATLTALRKNQVSFPKSLPLIQLQQRSKNERIEQNGKR